eukprot:Hpha_TRINITY_DN3110_c0_g1::TRINITY_DN3110_c0_g1_i1::g.96814::m.96814
MIHVGGLSVRGKGREGRRKSMDQTEQKKRGRDYFPPPCPLNTHQPRKRKFAERRVWEGGKGEGTPGNDPGDAGGPPPPPSVFYLRSGALWQGWCGVRRHGHLFTFVGGIILGDGSLRRR